MLKHIKDNNNGVPNKGGKQIYTHTCTMHMNGCTQVHFMPAHHFIVFGCVVPVSVQEDSGQEHQDNDNDCQKPAEIGLCNFHWPFRKSHNYSIPNLLPFFLHPHPLNKNKVNHGKKNIKLQISHGYAERKGKCRKITLETRFHSRAFS